MNAYELIRMLRQKLDEKKREKLDALARGSAETFAHYKGQCSYIQCISHCEDWLQEVIRALHDPHNERGEV